MDSFRIAEIPVNTVRALDESGFIESSVYRPSKAKELDALIQRLTEVEKDLALGLSQEERVSETDAFQVLAPKGVTWWREPPMLTFGSTTAKGNASRRSPRVPWHCCES